jgi:hypothetical protein
VLLLAPSLRQSRLLFRRAAAFLQRIDQECIGKQTVHELDLTNESQIICLPCREETIRGYDDVRLLVIDEAARVPDDLYRAVTPMLAVSDGRLVCLSTPCGRRGFFYQAWAKGGDDWKRIEVPAEQVPRISPAYLEQARRQMGEASYRQEFGCSFEALEGLVYPDFSRSVVKATQAPSGRWVGGIDFGLRNPFAAVWGVLDRDDVLWLVGEHHAANQSLAYHARHLPARVTWYADPAGAREIHELRCAGLAIRPGDNERRPGIWAVRARLENGTLHVLDGACPNLLAEAQLYRYGEASESEDPVKEHDHALDALRYLISRLDQRKMARVRQGQLPEEPAPLLDGGGLPDDRPRAPERRGPRMDREELWTRVE